MAVLEGAGAAGCLIGLLGGGFIESHFGLPITAFVSVGIALAPIMCTAIFTVELSPRVDNSAVSDGSAGTNVSVLRRVGVTRMLDAIQCVFKKRDCSKRIRLNLCYVANAATSMAANGLVVNSFLYFHKQYGLPIENYTIYFSYIMGTVAVGGPLLLKAMTTCMRQSSAVHGMLSAAVLVVGYAIMSVEVIPHCLWIGGALLAFQSVVYASVRSFAVQLVRADEIGKIFAYDAMLQVILQLTSSILFKWIYSLTVEVWAGFFVAFCGFLCSLSAASLLVVSRLSKSQHMTQNNENSPLLS